MQTRHLLLAAMLVVSPAPQAQEAPPAPPPGLTEQQIAHVMRARELMQEYRAAYRGKRWDECITLLEQVTALGDMGDMGKAFVAIALYNMACSYCLKGDEAHGLKYFLEAFEEHEFVKAHFHLLEPAAASNPWKVYRLFREQIEHVASDPDLQSLHDDLLFWRAWDAQRYASAGLQFRDWPRVRGPGPSDPAAPVFLLLHDRKEPLNTPHRLLDALFPVIEGRQIRVYSLQGRQQTGDDGGPGGYWDAYGDLIARRAAVEVKKEQDRPRDEKVYLIGVGAGAEVAFSTCLRKPDRFAGAILIGGAHGLERAEWKAAGPDAAKQGVAFFCIRGEQDIFCNLDSRHQNLAEMGFRTEYVSHPGGGGLPEDLELVARGLDFLLAR